ncbi:hypothetical protein CL656_05340, partial [bacterium]|nr:hypothetical protein [bacterium]
KISLNLFLLFLLPLFCNGFTSKENIFFPFQNSIGVKNSVESKLLPTHLITSHVDKKKELIHNTFLDDKTNKILEKSHTIVDDNIRHLGKNVVIYISGLLPKVDNIGHDVLHANNVFIKDILSNDSLSDEMKKHIILFSIKMAQYGDDMGSHILQFYYDIVDACL